MTILHMEDILHDSASEYLAQIESDYDSGLSGPKEYHAGLGKALAYVEAQYALGVLPENSALELIDDIEHRLEIS